MQLPTAHVPLPDIQIDASGTARSERFGDVYFSALGGVAETQHVFLQGNQLAERWMQRAITIGELGFGTGLNFLVTWDTHRRSGSPHALHYVAIERYPLTPAQLRAALAHYPALAALAETLMAAYPLRLPGVHRVALDGVSLTLAFGEAEALLPELQATVDAWFLDGFAPARNEAMWSQRIFRELARLSAPEATLATFTVAGAVRRGLSEAGFQVEKTKGYAHKREMLVGRRSATPAQIKVKPPQHVLVVGAGVAGCSVAHAFARRGAQVTLLDAQGIAAGASGNPAAVLYPQLTKYYTPATAWHFTAYNYMLQLLPRLAGVVYAQPGMFSMARDAEDEARLLSIRTSLQLDPAIARWMEPDEASARLNQSLTRGGFWFAQGSWLEPVSLCHAFARPAGITFRQANAMQVTAQEVVLESGERLRADCVVLATAYAVQQLLPTPLKLGRTSGQVTRLEGGGLDAILCHKGYAIAHSEGLLIGATYLRDQAATVTDAQHRQNLAELAQAAPALAMQPCILGGRASERATTPARLPYVGRAEHGVWLSVGHGSRGMLSAPLAAELLAAQCYGEVWPVGRGLATLLCPQRLQ